MRAHEVKGMSGPGVADHESPDQQLLGCVLSSPVSHRVFLLTSIEGWGGIHPTRKAKGTKGKQAKIPNSFQIDPLPANPIQELSLGIGFMRIRLLPLPLAAA